MKDDFVNEFRDLVKGWHIKEILPPQAYEGGICKFILENNGKERHLTLCSSIGPWVEKVVDVCQDREAYQSFDLMLIEIRDYVDENSDEIAELEALYGTDESICLPMVKFGSIEPLEDVKNLQLGFGFIKDDTEWWTTTKAIKASNHPWKKFMCDPAGRRKVADLLCRNWMFDPRYKESMGK